MGKQLAFSFAQDRPSFWFIAKEFKNDWEGEIQWAFKGLPGGIEAFNAEFGESWQYMGTILYKGVFYHQFRHRMHPSTQQREYRNIPATQGWEPPPGCNPY